MIGNINSLSYCRKYISEAIFFISAMLYSTTSLLADDSSISNQEAFDSGLEFHCLPSYHYTTSEITPFDFFCVGEISINDSTYHLIGNSVNDLVIPIYSDNNGKSYVLTPKEGWDISCYELYCNQEYGKWRKNLLYDFDLTPGTVYEGLIGQHYYPGNRFLLEETTGLVISEIRSINLLGESRKAMKINSAHFDLSPEPFGSWMISNLPRIIVEGIGDISESSICGIPVVLNYMPSIQGSKDFTPVCEWWSFSSEDGTNVYMSREELGLQLYDQLLYDDSIWEYYSEDDCIRAVHRLGIIGNETVGDKDYKVIAPIQSFVSSNYSSETTIYERNDFDSAVKWLMREDFGRIYVLLPDGKESLLYDFALQNDETIEIGQSEFSINNVCTNIRIAGLYGNKFRVKSYTVQSDDGISTICTEFIGCHGKNSGFLPFPVFYQSKSIADKGITPETPASDCTLTRFLKKGNLEKYASPEYYELAEPLLLEAAGTDCLPSDEATQIPDACFDIFGRLIDPASATGITLIRSNGKVRKVLR